jgi:putative endonuclease
MKAEELKGMTIKQLGVWGEDYATKYFERLGYKIVERNWHDSIKGEVDIIAFGPGTPTSENNEKVKDELVFIEVKTRRTVRKGNPIEAVDEKKYKQIRQTVKAYLNTFDGPIPKLRIDVVGILAQQKGIHLKHVKGVKMWD